MELNLEQKIAVQESSRDFVLAAAAGSGKTRVLTERFVNAVAACGRDAFTSTLAITFTEKAAGELWQRVRDGVARASGSEMAAHTDLAWISTIHSMCSRLLRRHALEVGLDPSLVIGSPVELGILKQQAFEDIALLALDQRGASATLIHQLGHAGAFKVVVDVAERVRAMGLTARDIETAPAMHRSTVAALLTDLENLAAEYESLARSQTVIDNLEWLTGFIASAHEWSLGRMQAEAFARIASSPRQNRRGAAAETAQAVKDVAEELALLAAQEAVRTHEQALVELVQAFTERYARSRRETNLLDFEDLQSYVVELFERHPEIAARYHAQFSSVMIDEFQDTNAMQVRLIESLAPQGFAAVGDERQSIYRFRHADVDIFTRRVSDAATRHTLRTNYRSHPELVSFFNDLFGAEPFWPDDFMRLRAGRQDSGDETVLANSRITALLVDEALCGDSRDADEARIIAAHVRRLVDGGVDPADIVILLRAMTVAETFAGALRDAGVEVFVASGGTYFSRPEVIDIEMLLRVVANTKDDEALLHVLAGPLTALSDDGLANLRFSSDGGSLWSACLTATGSLASEDQASLARLIEMVQWFKAQAGSIGLAEMIHEACERLEYDLTLFASGFDGARSWVNVLKLARIAQEFEQANPGDPQAFLEYLDLKRELEGRESLAAFAAEDVDAVRIMSVHAAKGLEFPVTIVANLGRRPVTRGGIVLSTIGGTAFLGMKLPAGESGSDALATVGYREAQRRESEADLAEEKRLFYVACTRAREALVLCGRTDFSKEAESPRLIGWLRDALRFGSPESICEGPVPVGDSTVSVLTPVPVECGPVGIVRPSPEPDILRIAAHEQASPPDTGTATIERISYSGLSLHRKCPYRFYVTNVMRMGGRTAEATGNDAAVALGTAVHALFKVSGGASASLTPERIDEICDAAGLQSDMRGQAIDLVRSFERSDTGLRIASCSRVLRERPFAVMLGETVLDGFIDVIGWEGENALVVDYKTGDPSREHDAEEYRTQAECYAIAALALGAERVEVRFVELRSGGREIHFDFTRDDSNELLSRYTAEIDDIVAGTYRPLGTYSPYACPECPALGNLCPVSSPVPRSSG